MITIPSATIVSPTDFKVRLHCADGSFDPSRDYLQIEFFIEDMRYEVVCDPESDHYVNCRLDNGDLLVIFENYPFVTGNLKYRMHARTTDADFSDEYADKYSTEASTGIEFIR